MSAFGGQADMGLCPPITHAASVDCLLYFINRGLRRQGIGSRSNRHAVFAVPNEDFERGAVRFPNLSAPPLRLTLVGTDFKALINFGSVHLSSYPETTVLPICENAAAGLFGWRRNRKAAVVPATSPVRKAASRFRLPPSGQCRGRFSLAV